MCAWQASWEGPWAAAGKHVCEEGAPFAMEVGSSPEREGLPVALLRVWALAVPWLCDWEGE